MMNSPDPEETLSQPSEPHSEISLQTEDKTKWSAALTEFADKLNGFPTPEEKIAYGLQFMRETISQEGSPRFREFWESRRLVLPIFKENINPAIRSQLWGEYVELTVEARRLKEILEEQSAFAIEQIDLAIQGVETDFKNVDKLLEQQGTLAFPELSQISPESYSLQRELNVLNNLASRLNGLRKEIIKTDMRIRYKTKFFKRLSELGDHVFPKRKELIEQVSAQFEKDVDAFVDRHFRDGEVGGMPYYALREEIKSLQGMAKVLTLNSGTFNRTRMKLSECWDQVKVLEKEHKKVVQERKQASSGARLALQAKIEELKPQAEAMALKDLDGEIEKISQEMRATPLDRDDVRFLREELMKLRAPHVAALEQRAKELEEAEKEKIRLKREKVAQVKDQIAALVKDGAKLSLEELSAQFEQVSEALSKLDTTKIEKQQLERQLRPLKDTLAEKKEQSLLNLSDDDRKALESLRLVLQQKKERRQEIKEQLESYRKMLGSSNLDFEKAMSVRELVEQEKERLEKANAGIEEIEEKIEELEG